MTNLQALQSVIGVNYPFDVNMYNKALLDIDQIQGQNLIALDPSAAYSSANARAIDFCVAGLILTIVSSPDVQEGGYKITQADRADLLQTRALILAKYGLSVGTTFNRNASNKW